MSFELGGLMILEGSNNLDRVKNDYAKKDVDEYCERKPAKPGIKMPRSW